MMCTGFAIMCVARGDVSVIDYTASSRITPAGGAIDSFAPHGQHRGLLGTQIDRFVSPSDSSSDIVPQNSRFVPTVVLETFLRLKTVDCAW